MIKIKLLFIFFFFISFSLFSQIECRLLKFPFEEMLFYRNDTVFKVWIYPSKEKIDSIKYGGYAVKISKNKWETNTSLYDSSYSIEKYKRIKPSKWFMENNEKYFQADYECRIKTFWRYYPDGRIDIYRRIGPIAYIKQKKYKKTVEIMLVFY